MKLTTPLVKILRKERDSTKAVQLLNFKLAG